VHTDKALQYDFLIHAILGLAAAHLDMTSTSNLGEVALSHRILAIKGLNKALSQPPKTRTDADALLSSCYALSMQSSFLGQSVEDFLVMFRGCRLIIEQQWRRNLGSAFHDLDLDRQAEIATLKFSPVPIIDESAIEAAKKSFERLRPLCEKGVEKKVLGHLEMIVNALEDSSIGGVSSPCNSLRLTHKPPLTAIVSLFQLYDSLHWLGYTARIRISGAHR
jgi:hypothetical protein